MSKINKMINLNDLPKNYKGILWNKSIGCKVNFIYDDVVGEVVIIKYEKGIITFIYNNHTYSMHRTNFIKCKFGAILNKINCDYKFDIGYNINEGIIIERKKEKINDKHRRLYLVECKNCKDKRWVREEHLNKYNCTICGDGISYPEKVMRYILKSLGVNFISQLNKKTFSWCNKYRYDFYLPDYNMIIETHGEQHYREISFMKTLNEQKEIDQTKEKLALNAGINTYIKIDCRYSNIEWIKNQILNSEINKIFNLNKINWNKADMFATNSLVKEVCEYYNTHKYDFIQDIAIHFNLSHHTIGKYIKKGEKLGLCEIRPRKGKKINFK